jgi:hypothetical protein
MKMPGRILAGSGDLASKNAVDALFTLEMMPG